MLGIDDCLPEPANVCNHGSCVDRHISFDCSCDLGWDGSRCNEGTCRNHKKLLIHKMLK